MTVAHFPNVLQLREKRIDSVQQPKVSCFGGREFCKHLPTLSAGTGEGGTLRGKNLNLATQQTAEIIAGCKIKTRCNESWIQRRSASRITSYLSNAQNRIAVAIFILEQQTKGSSRNLDGLLLCAGVVVGDHLCFSKISSSRQTTRTLVTV